MSQFRTHTPETAPKDSREVLENVREAYGFIPNMIGTLAESPAAARGYTTLSGIFADSSLSAVEQQVVLLTASRENGCEYCVAAHSATAAGKKVDEAVIDAIRDDKTIEDERLEALRRLTSRVIETRGWLQDDDVRAFESAGYDKAALLDVILGVALKTISNYTNHVAGTELDERFEKAAWQAPRRDAA